MSQHTHDHAHDSEPQQQTSGSAQADWDARYSERDQIWSGKPNNGLVSEASDLTPGRALDLGCGEGGDAIWLAQQGWTVTATDISPVALKRAAQHASDAGVADQIDWQHIDLSTGFPEGTFDLISAQFLQSFVDLPREEILRTAAAAIAPGGVLLIVSHAALPSWAPEDRKNHDFPQAADVLKALQLADRDWELLRSENVERPHSSPDGEAGTSTDSVVKVRRKA